MTEPGSLNAINFEVIYQSTLQIARELTLNMLRTGYSTIIKESQDFNFAIFDADARMVAQGIPQPLHIGPITAQVREIRRRFVDTAEPGDAFIVNPPYQACQNHATDITIITPLFVADRLVGYIGNTAHKPDIGGKVPGTNSGDATDLFQEGLLIPPLRILRRGVMNDGLREVICANTRTPEVTWGDIQAQVNTNSYGVQKFAELFGKYGVDRVLACWSRWMDICESELRKEIAKVPDGVYGPETDYLDDDGVEIVGLRAVDPIRNLGDLFAQLAFADIHPSRPAGQHAIHAILAEQLGEFLHAIAVGVDLRLDIAPRHLGGPRVGADHLPKTVVHHPATQDSE